MPAGSQNFCQPSGRDQQGGGEASLIADAGKAKEQAREKLSSAPSTP